MALSAKQRKKVVDGLITNCSCNGKAVWSEDDREVLNSFDDERLELLAENQQVSTENAIVANAVRETFGEEVDSLEANAVPAFLKKKVAAVPADEEEEEEEEEEEVPVAMKRNKKGPPTKNSARTQPKTSKEWLAEAPPEVQEAVQNAMEIQNAERKKLIGLITANVEDAAEKEALVADLATEKLPRLRILAKAAGKGVTSNQANGDGSEGSLRPALFLGQNSAPAANAAGMFGGGSLTQEERSDVLPDVVANYEEWAKEDAELVEAQKS